MTLTTRLALIPILVAHTAMVPAQTAGTSSQSQPADVQLARLAGLGRLWGYIKYAHPWIGHKNKEWDQALVAAIPRAKSAASAEQYGLAIDHMLSFLGDPATRRIVGNTRPGDVVGFVPNSDRKQPYIDWLDPETAVITASDYAAIDSSPTGRNDLQRLIAEAGKAKTVVLDIRRVRDAKNMQRIGGTVSAALNGAMWRLVPNSVPLPASQFVYHQGYAPQSGPYPFYYSGLLTISGGEYRIPVPPSPVPRPNRLVFIVNAGSLDLYSLMTGLQDQGIAAVVQEGDENPDAGVTFTFTSRVMDLPDGITLQVRRGEFVRANGATGFRPDVVVPAPITSGSDPAQQAALELGKKLASTAANDQRTPQLPRRLSFVDGAYPEMPYPTEEYRLLGLFRFWSAIEYFFPYKELMDRPWEHALTDFIPKMQQARDATEYALTVAELVTRLQDSHGQISSPAFESYLGTHRPPVRLDPVEGHLAVTRVDPPASGSIDLRVGDVVLAIDNEDIATRRDRLARYLPASTPGSLHNSQAREVLRGAKDSEVVLKVRTPQGAVKEVKLIRSVAGANRYVEKRTVPVFSVLPDGFGYVDLDRLIGEQAKAAYDAVKNTPGLVIDLRGYIDSGSQEFLNAMAAKAKEPALLVSQVEYDGMSGKFRKNVALQPSFSHPGTTPYRGKVAVMISTVTASASESACMTLAAIGVDVTFIGAPTTGANGNVTNATLPGGIAARFTGMEIKYPDGRQLQRRGVQPDIPAAATIHGIAAGRDEVLERAVAFLKGGKVEGKREKAKDSREKVKVEGGR